MGKYTNVEHYKSISVKRDFYELTRNDLNSRNYKSLIKRVIDFYDEFVDDDYIMPNPIILNNLTYWTKEGYAYNLDRGCSIAYNKDADDIIRNTKNKVYEYKGKLYKFCAAQSSYDNSYYEPRLCCIDEVPKDTKVIKVK